jgi:hypothetical protein
MHGLRSSEDDDTDRTSNERRTEERGSLAKGAVSAFRGCGGGPRVWGCHTLVAETEAIEDRELPVPLTSRLFRAALRGTRAEGATLMGGISCIVL